MQNTNFLTYLFQPEDSTLGLTEGISHKIPQSLRTAKVMLWVSVSFLVSMGISQLT